MSQDQQAWAEQARQDADKLAVTLLSNHRVNKDDRERAVKTIRQIVAALRAQG